MSRGADYTKKNEGCRLAAYDDATGQPLKSGEKPQGVCTIAYGDTGPDVIPGLVITQSEADARFDRKYPIACSDAIASLMSSAWQKLGADRQAVLADMAYQMGGAGLRHFQMMLRALERQDWQTAHDECLDSDYARHQAPNRAARNALALLDGVLRFPA